MTILEAIHRVDALKPNAYTQHDKVMWLAALDGRVQIEVYDTHHDSPREYHDYTDDTALDTMLLVPNPYDDLYVPWLSMQIDEQNREIVSYNNNAAAFQAKYADFKAYWNRTHKPKSERLCFFGRRHHHADPLSD
jgi:hypothetical protein